MVNVRVRVLILLIIFTLVAVSAQGEVAQKGKEAFRVAIVGDTGIGERAYRPGFLAVQKALRESTPDLLLHLGDFVYQPEFFPSACNPKYIREVKETLVDPFPARLFVAGDNDFPPIKWKPKASGCWEGIAPMGTAFDASSAPAPVAKPRKLEGTLTFGPVLFAVVNNYPWKDPRSWLEPRIRRAREQGKWIVLAYHEPAVTTAWFVDKRKTALKEIQDLKPDLTFSGNQHSYERFYPLTGPQEDGSFSVVKENTYRQGQGTTHIVSGGGGAFLKPFADMQKNAERSAPAEIFDALAKRALMNHFVILDITPEKIVGTTYRVCPGNSTGEANPRWRPQKKFWQDIRLECDGKAQGVESFDRFEIVRED
ncbi:MAG: hypothetical protein COV66_12065 [Nitrospinae bacterium CG11_big_fil_rev_8_21_14_0_20_45_15]|nr:MAG: hypothetical protein COV66_12065 [Nitrospinae bacterium CG11_big_fil_rev_8_21_14_0_20_45_15]